MTPVLAPHSPNFHTTPMQSFLVSDTFSVNRANAPFVENGAEELSTFVMEPFQFQEGIFAVELDYQTSWDVFVTAVVLPLRQSTLLLLQRLFKKPCLSPLVRDLRGEVSLNDSCYCSFLKLDSKIGRQDSGREKSSCVVVKFKTRFENRRIRKTRGIQVCITFQEQLSRDLFSVGFGNSSKRSSSKAALNEMAVVPDFHKRILFSDEAHFWLNGYLNKQNCRIWSEANPQVYVETPLHPEKLTVWCALWAGGILLQKR
ncbi:hypothetical protein TNCV_1216332 [Trichonephila clavipes]|nr:hypothetical protein TNCV_1216332 [Trichonephila clavipes]